MMRRSPMPPRRTPLVARVCLSRSTPLRKVSDRRAREQRVYDRRRPLFLAAHARCTFPGGCAQPSSEVHHRMGRVGTLFLDESHWSALCHDHHEWVTAHPAQAVAMGISELRVSGAA